MEGSFSVTRRRKWTFSRFGIFVEITGCFFFFAGFFRCSVGKITVLFTLNLGNYYLVFVIITRVTFLNAMF